MFINRQKIFWSVIAAITLGSILITVAFAGATQDYGQLPGAPVPAQVNYVAWMGNAGTPPSQVLTEDGYNSPGGLNTGYCGGYWLLNASNFNNPSASNGASLNFVFGGLGADNGTIWTYSATYDNTSPTTNHGTVGTPASGTCPSMTSGSWNGTQKVINWSGPAGKYLIYRSIFPSGANNKASNGRYDYVATVTTITTTGTYTDNVNVESWHIVVPADPTTSAIIGCHSEESSPTAVTMVGFTAKSGATGILPISIALGLFCCVAIGVLGYWKMQDKRRKKERISALYP